MSDTYDYAVPDVGIMANGNSVHQPLIVSSQPPPLPKIPIDGHGGTSTSSGSSSAGRMNAKNNNHQASGLYDVSEAPVKKVMNMNLISSCARFLKNDSP